MVFPHEFTSVYGACTCPVKPPDFRLLRFGKRARILRKFPKDRSIGLQSDDGGHGGSSDDHKNGSDRSRVSASVHSSQSRRGLLIIGREVHADGVNPLLNGHVFPEIHQWIDRFIHDAFHLPDLGGVHIE